MSTFVPDVFELPSPAHVRAAGDGGDFDTGPKHSRKWDEQREHGQPPVEGEREDVPPDAVVEGIDSSRPEERPPQALAPERSVAELVEAVRRGDRKAGEKLYRDHVRALNNLAVRLAPWPDLAEDIVQDSFITAFEKLHTLEQPQAFGCWLRKIAINKAYKVLRRHRLTVTLGLARRGAAEIELVVDKSASPAIRSEICQFYGQLNRLNTEARVYLTLRRIEDLTIEEIAKQCNVSVSTAKRRIAAAERQLKRIRRDPAHCGRNNAY